MVVLCLFSQIQSRTTKLMHLYWKFDLCSCLYWTMGMESHRPAALQDRAFLQLSGHPRPPGPSPVAKDCKESAGIKDAPRIWIKLFKQKLLPMVQWVVLRYFWIAGTLQSKLWSPVTIWNPFKRSQKSASHYVLCKCLGKNLKRKKSPVVYSKI